MLAREETNVSCPFCEVQLKEESHLLSFLRRRDENRRYLDIKIVSTLTIYFSDKSAPVVCVLRVMSGVDALKSLTVK